MKERTVKVKNKMASENKKDFYNRLVLEGIGKLKKKIFMVI